MDPENGQLVIIPTPGKRDLGNWPRWWSRFGTGAAILHLWLELGEQDSADCHAREWATLSSYSLPKASDGGAMLIRHQTSSNWQQLGQLPFGNVSCWPGLLWHMCGWSQSPFMYQQIAARWRAMLTHQRLLPGPTSWPWSWKVSHDEAPGQQTLLQVSDSEIILEESWGPPSPSLLCPQTSAPSSPAVTKTRRTIHNSSRPCLSYTPPTRAGAGGKAELFLPGYPGSSSISLRLPSKTCPLFPYKQVSMIVCESAVSRDSVPLCMIPYCLFHE